MTSLPKGNVYYAPLTGEFYVKTDNGKLIPKGFDEYYNWLTTFLIDRSKNKYVYVRSWNDTLESRAEYDIYEPTEQV